MDPTTYRMLSGAADAGPPPVEITFTSGNYYPFGTEPSGLSWNVLNSASRTINQGIGSVAESGSTSVVGVSESRTYVLTALGLDGITYTSSVTISWGADCIWWRYGRPERC